MSPSRRRFIRTLRARWLGHCLRQIREQCDLSLKDVAAEIGIEFSTLARFERAEWPFRRDQYVEPLLDVYGIYDETTRADLLQMAQQAWRIHHWHLEATPDTHPTPTHGPIQHYPPLAWILAQADQICSYSLLTVPDLLQTEDYIHALLRSTDTHASESKVERQARERLELQTTLAGSPPPRLCAIVDEQVLLRPIRGTDVFARQLGHIRDLIERPDLNVEVRVVPTQASATMGIDGPFTVLRMAHGYPTVAIVPHLGGYHIIEATLAGRYDNLHQWLTADALDPIESRAVIETRAKELA